MGIKNKSEIARFITFFFNLWPTVPPPTVPQCWQPEDSGTCNTFARYPMPYTSMRWRYDKGSRSCVRFRYSGCGGNENNFRSRWACMRTCGRKCKFFFYCFVSVLYGSVLVPHKYFFIFQFRHFELSIIHFELSVIHFKLSVIQFEVYNRHFKLSIIHFELSIIHFKLSIIQFELSIIQFEVYNRHFKLSIIHFKLSIIHFNLSIIHFNLSIIHFKLSNIYSDFFSSKLSELVISPFFPTNDWNIKIWQAFNEDTVFVLFVRCKFWTPKGDVTYSSWSQRYILKLTP